MDLPATRQLCFAGITVQDGGVLDLQSYYGDASDQWTIEVGVMLTVEKLIVCFRLKKSMDAHNC